MKKHRTLGLWKMSILYMFYGGSIRFLLNVGTRHVFLRKFLCFRFSRSLKANGKVMSKVRTIAYVCCSKYYQTDFCY